MTFVLFLQGEILISVSVNQQNILIFSPTQIVMHKVMLSSVMLSHWNWHHWHLIYLQLHNFRYIRASWAIYYFRISHCYPVFFLAAAFSPLLASFSNTIIQQEVLICTVTDSQISKKLCHCTLTI